MTPKEKAKELIEKFTEYSYEYEVVNSVEDTNEWNAKQSALILVDEILNASIVGEGWLTKYEPYWIDVKKEINKYQTKQVK
jgi:hypothetical protein